MGGKKPKQGGKDQAGSQADGDLLRAVGKRLIPVLISAGSLLGFVAFAGGVILWTRFHAIGVPPEQAVDAIPDGELIATGSVLLLLFGFFGALALVLAFLVDRGARPTPGMALVLLSIFALEGVVAILLVEGPAPGKTVIGLMLFLPPVVGAAWATRLGGLTELVDDLTPRSRECCGPVDSLGFLRPAGELNWGPPWVFAPFAILVVSTVAAIPLVALECDTALRVVLGVSAVILLATIGTLLVGDRIVDRRVRREERKACAKRKVARAEKDVGGTEPKADRRRIAKAKGKLTRLRAYLSGRWGCLCDVAEPRSCRSETKENVEQRMRKRRPRRLNVKAWGWLLMIVLLTVAVALPSWWLDKPDWLVAGLLTAALATGAVWRVAMLENERLVWFGLALFLSVPLFGTAMTMARNLTEPKVQPVAIIRSSDGSDEAIQGLYVTETDDRVYFANVATEGCGEVYKRNSSRLLWVPKDDVVAMSIGPTQDVKSAGRAAQEMANALTPDIETASGENVTLRAPGEGGDSRAGDTADGEPKEPGTRLVDPGPAVRPEFGRRLKVKPKVAAPGATVTLTRPKLKLKQEGFGDNSDGEKKVRLNGMEVKAEEWTKEEIKFVVPENATSGEVTIGCEALAGAPYLTVSRKPKARISVMAKPGTNRVVLDGRRSYDDGEIKKFEWRVSGLKQGKEKKARIVRSLRPRTGFYRVRLTVTDDEGETDTKAARILRLPAPHFEFNRDAPESKRMITHLLKAFSRDAAKDRREANKKAEKYGGEWTDYIEPPGTIEIAGHADDVGTAAYNGRLSWRRAVGVWRALYKREADKKVGQVWAKGLKEKPKLTIRGFGETCPMDPGGGRLRKNRRVEIFVLDDGARAIFPRTCHAVYVKHATWGEAPP